MTETDSSGGTAPTLHAVLEEHLSEEQKQHHQKTLAHTADDDNNEWLAAYIQNNLELDAIEAEDTDSTAYRTAKDQAELYEAHPAVQAGELTALEHYEEVIADTVADIDLRYRDELESIYTDLKEQKPELPDFQDLN